MTRARINAAAIEARLAVILPEVVDELAKHGDVLIRVDRAGDLFVDRTLDEES